jgi:hypothetical protein
MFRKVIMPTCLAVAAIAPTTVPAMAQTAAAAAPAYSTADTDIGTLIDTAETKAIVDKHMPGFSGNPQIAMARSMTLKQIQGFSGDQITDAKLAAIDADLAKLPAKK